jgi:phosphohistidine phosphatase SixA
MMPYPPVLILEPLLVPCHQDEIITTETEAVRAPDGLVQREGLGPNDQVDATKEALEQTGDDLMIVGHLPFLGD